MIGNYLTNASAFQASGNYLTTFSPLEGTYLSILNAQSTLTSYLTLTGASSIYQTIANMSNYITSGSLTTYVISGSLTDYQPVASMSNYITSGSLTTYITSGSLTAYQPVANMATYVTSGSLTAYQTIADLTKSSVGLGNVDNTGASSLPISTATQTALGLKATIESPIFTGTPKLTISSLNCDLITQPRVGGWLQFSSMTVQKQIGLNNFSVVRSPGYAAGSFDISFPAHPAGGAYMIIFTPRLSSGVPALYGYGGIINSTGFTVRFTNISGTFVDAELNLFIQRN